MRKLPLVLGAILLTFALAASTTTAKSSNKAKQWNGKLTPVAVGATAPVGAAHAVQNKKRFKLSVRARELTVGGVYGVNLYEDSDGLGCTSTANIALNPPAFKPITANADGHGRTKVDVRRTVFQLDATKSYYVSISDSANATVACGALVAKAKKSHSHPHPIAR